MVDGDKKKILQLLRSRDAANAKADAAAVLAPYADDAVIYELPPPLQVRGNRAHGEAALKAWFGTWDGPVTVELPEPEIIVDGDLAVVFGLARIRGAKKQDGPVDSWNRRTVVLRRQRDGWRVVHEHNSYPLKMDGSGKAATNLKP